MEHLIDKTILSTPKPCAWSTVEKKEFLNKIDKKYGARSTEEYDSICEDNESINSLGIIYDIEEKEDLPVALSGDDSINTHLQIQRKLAHNALEKSRIGLPAKFLIPSNTPRSIIKKNYNNTSTVNESDLLKLQASGIRESITSNNFVPADVSTPKTSNVSQVSERQFKNLSDVIGDASKRIRNSDINLQDVCSELCGLSMGNSRMSNIDSGMFVPAELMEEKLLEDEMSWREKRDLPRNSKNISNLSSITGHSNSAGKYSMGNFFKQRCEDINNEFFKKSPEKGEPVPLVDLTNTISVIDDLKEDTESSSVMSATQIYKILSECGLQDPQQILNRLTQKKKRRTRESRTNDSLVSERGSVISERDVDEYILANKGYKNENRGSNVDKNVCLPDVMTTSPTVVWDNSQKQHCNYNKFCQNLELEQKSPIDLEKSSRLSPNILSRISKSSSYVIGSTANSPTENKENISDSDRSLTSVRSGSSLDIPEGKFPIKSNRLELIWGCLKIGRTSMQEFQIKNQLNQRIRMQAAITGSAFRIAKDNYDSEMLTVTSFILRPLEIKAFTIIFCPTKIGAAAEKINFYPIIGGEIQQSKRQVLTLFGYGGHISCDISNIMKDSGGKLWLSLGKIDYQTYVEQKFVIKNSGNLLAFVYMDVVSKGPITYSDLNLEPKEFLLNPQEELTVTVRYRPSKQELKHLKKIEIVEVGHIKLITGAEVTRGRLRRLYTKLQQKNTPVDPFVERLCGIFPGENLPPDLRYFKESVSAVKELLSHFTVKEITVTLEQDLENTLVNPIMDMNETTMYHTLQQDDDDATEFGNVTAIRRDHQRLFTIEPTSILLTLPMKREDTILLYSQNPQEMTFKITSEPAELLRVYPSHGVLGPYEATVIKVLCHPQNSMMVNKSGRILICIEEEVLEITVKTIFIKT